MSWLETSDGGIVWNESSQIPSKIPSMSQMCLLIRVLPGTQQSEDYSWSFACTRAARIDPAPVSHVKFSGYSGKRSHRHARYTCTRSISATQLSYTIKERLDAPKSHYHPLLNLTNSQATINVRQTDLCHYLGCSCVDRVLSSSPDPKA